MSEAIHALNSKKKQIYSSGYLKKKFLLGVQAFCDSTIRSAPAFSKKSYFFTYGLFFHIWVIFSRMGYIESDKIIMSKTITCVPMTTLWLTSISASSMSLPMHREILPSKTTTWTSSFPCAVFPQIQITTKSIFTANRPHASWLCATLSSASKGASCSGFEKEMFMSNDKIHTKTWS